MPRTRAGLPNISQRYNFIMFIEGFGVAEFVAEKGGQPGGHRLLRRHCTSTKDS
jgi:hypothetical protein